MILERGKAGDGLTVHPECGNAGPSAKSLRMTARTATSRMLVGISFSAGRNPRWLRLTVA